MTVTPIRPQAPRAARVVGDTEAALVQQFAAAAATDLRYDHARQAWFVWAGHAWRPDGDGAPVRRLQAWLGAQLAAAAAIADRADREHQIGFLQKLLRASTLRHLLRLAGDQTELATDGSAWDANVLLVATANGVMDLTTGGLRPGRPADMMTRSLGPAYDPPATCPRWLHYLAEAVPADDTRDSLQRAIGYTLSGLTVERKFFAVIGPTGTGKTTLLETLHALFGTYAATLPFASLTQGLERGGSAATPDVAALPGVRFAKASESRKGARLDEDRLKLLTGGDTVPARQLYGKPFFFTPQFRLWLATNDLPRAAVDDGAFWARCCVFPFRVQRPEAQQDRTLRDALHDELAGVLNWALEGFGAYRARGLDPSPDMRRETSTWRDANDDLAPFLETQTGLARVEVSELFRRYRQWASDEHFAERDQMSRIKFGRAVAAKFPTKRSNGKTWADLAVQECRL